MRASFVASFLLAALALQPCSGSPPGHSATTAYVVPSMQQDNPSNHSYRRFGSIVMNREMLKQYDTVMLTSDYRVTPAAFAQEPTRLSRNLTVTSANYSKEGYKLLELDFAVQRVLIPQGLRLTFKDLALGRARQTPGQGVPFVVGEGQQSLLVLDNVVRIRTACAHNEPGLVTSLSSIPRRDPSSNGRSNRNSTANASSSMDEQLVELLPTYGFRGELYYDSIHARDVRYFVGPVDVPDTNYYAGYSMWQINSTRICETYVSDECVVRRGAEACVEEQIALLIKPREAAAAPSRQLSGTNLAAVVAPSVVGGSLLLAGVALVIFMKRRRGAHKVQADGQHSLLPVSDKGGPSKGRPGLKTQPHEATQPHDDGGPDVPRRPNSPTVPLGPSSGADGSIEQLAIGARPGSWQLSAFHAAPEFSDATPHGKLALGVLLGAGSYGRVYQGVWRKRDVAVKVLQHDSSTAAAIANEVNLVMSFRHPNIIEAYYFLTWSRAASSAPLQDTWYHADQVTSSEGTFSPTSTQQLLSAGGMARSPFSAVGSCQQLPYSSGAAKGQLTPLVEAPSGSGTQHSSGAVLANLSAGAILPSSSAMSSGGTSTSLTVRVSLSGQGLQQADAGSPFGAHMQAPAGYSAVRPLWSSAQGAYSAGNSSSNNAMHSTGGSSSSSAGVVTVSTARRADTRSSVGSVAYTHAQAAQPAPTSAQAVLCSFGGLGAAGEPQREQPPQQQFLPVLPAHRSPSTDSAAGHVSQSSGLIVPSASVQLFPFTTGRVSPIRQHDGLPQQQQRRNSAPVSEGIAYEVSVDDSSISGVPAACSSSIGAGTSASLIPAAYGAYQQQPQQQVPLQRFVAVLQRDSPSPVPQSQSQWASQQQEAGWLQDTCSTSLGPSGNKLLGKARSADEAQTWLITELMDGGTLLDLLAPGGQLGPEVAGRRRMGQVLTLLLDIATGMSYLHRRNVLHGDLKPCNVLIKHVQGAPYGRVGKVSDFGLSRALQTGQSHRSTWTFGTLNHTPPEALRLGRLSPAGDVYAFGIIMWEAFTGEVAFHGLHYGEVFEQVALLQRRPDIPPGMPSDYAELMTSCWAADPLVRPSFTTVTQQLEAVLSNVMQDDAEAQARFVSDL